MAAVALAGFAGQTLLGPALGVGGLSLAGGAAAMGMFNCPGTRPCRVRIVRLYFRLEHDVPDGERMSSEEKDQRKVSVSHFCWKITETPTVASYIVSIFSLF